MPHASLRTKHEDLPLAQRKPKRESLASKKVIESLTLKEEQELNRALLRSLHQKRKEARLQAAANGHAAALSERSPPTKPAVSDSPRKLIRSGKTPATPPRASLAGCSTTNSLSPSKAATQKVRPTSSAASSTTLPYFEDFLMYVCLRETGELPRDLKHFDTLDWKKERLTDLRRPPSRRRKPVGNEVSDEDDEPSRKKFVTRSPVTRRGETSASKKARELVKRSKLATSPMKKRGRPPKAPKV